MTNSTGRFELRPKDVAVFAVFAIVILAPFLWQWTSGFRLPPSDTGAELRAQQREDFRKANPGPPFRSFRTPAISQAVTVFASGPQDTIRTDMGGIICSVVDVEEQHGYLVWIPERNGLATYQLANLRFCSHLVLMGNPKIESLEAKLSKLPKPTPLVELLQPLDEVQTDGPFQFSQLAVAPGERDWRLTGQVLTSVDPPPKFTWFRYELHQGDQVSKGDIEIENLQAGRLQPFSTPLTSTRGTLTWNPPECRIKLVLRVTGDQGFNRQR